MAIPAYDAHDPVPWNTDSGKVAGGTDREGVALDWSTDLRVDPTGSTTVGKGWNTPAPRTDEV
jgi:hypothetical protein